MQILLARACEKGAMDAIVAALNDAGYVVKSHRKVD